MNEDILKKLTKLLNLSKSANEHEAQMALAKAAEIATNAGIDLAIVAAKDVNTESEKLEMVEDSINTGARLPVLQKYASWLLNKHFGVHVIYGGSRYFGKTVSFLGDKKDVEFAKFVNNFVQEDMQRRWDYYKKSNNLSVKFKATFMYNCYRGFNDALTAAKLATEETRFGEMEATTRKAVEGKYALVLTTKKEKVETFVSKMHPRLRTVKVSVGNAWASGSVAKDGYATGQTMKVARPLSC